MSNQTEELELKAEKLKDPWLKDAIINMIRGIYRHMAALSRRIDALEAEDEEA